MTHNLDPKIFKVIAVAEPTRRDELVFVMVTLANMHGEKKEERITFNDVITAWDFYKTQRKILENQKQK